MSQAVYFKVSGEFVTEQARTFLIEDNWEDGLYLLKDCVTGCDYEIAVSIITGERKFIGTNTLELVDEDPEIKKEWEQRFAHVFAGIYRDSNDYWRPYAYVDGWCEHDLNGAAMRANQYVSWESAAIPVRHSSVYQTWAGARNTFYMNNWQNDRSSWNHLQGRSVAILWAKVRVPPPWITVFRDRQQAIDDYIQHRWLEHRGAHQFLVVQTKKAPPEPSDDVKAARERFEQEQEERFDKEYVAIAERIHRHSLETTCGWLSPNGQLIPCLYSEHDFFALVILRERYNIDKTSGLVTRGDALIKRGWIKLQFQEWWALHKTDFQVTQRQFDIIWDYCQKHGRSMPEGIEIK